MTSNEIGDLNKECIVILPVGSIEAHGAHLPVGADINIAEMFAIRLAEETDCILAPSITYGPCETMLKFPGTITIENKVLYSTLLNVLESIISHGFRNIYILNGHGGNTGVIRRIISRLNKKDPRNKINFCNWYEQEVTLKLKSNDLTYRGEHADRMETEMMMLAMPATVHLESAVDHLPTWPSDFENLADYSEIMKFGVEGFPSFSKIEKARSNYEMIFRSMVYDIKDKYEKS